MNEEGKTCIKNARINEKLVVVLFGPADISEHLIMLHIRNMVEGTIFLNISLQMRGKEKEIQLAWE